MSCLQSKQFELMTATGRNSAPKSGVKSARSRKIIAEYWHKFYYIDLMLLYYFSTIHKHCLLFASRFAISGF